MVIVPAPGVSHPDWLVDDGLFMKWSVSILDGKWLGPWDILTTSKGPLHSLLTAAASCFGVNPFSYKRIFYFAGSLVFVVTGLRQAPAWLKLLTLVTLLLDPFQYSSVGLRNLREGTYIPIQLIAFALGSWSLDQLREQNRISLKLFSSITGTATCFGLILITREARIVAWVELAAWLFIGVVLVAWRHKHQLSCHLGIKILAVLLSLFAIIGWTAIPAATISALNRAHYGYSISNSFEEGLFPVLNGNLLSISIKAEPFTPRVHVTKSTIKTLINEAPPNGALAKILKNINPEWGVFGCELYPQTCGEIGGGWFTWALRYGISASLEPGSNEASFQKIIHNANRELDDICKRSTDLMCSTPKAGYLPPVGRWGFLHPIEESVAEASKIAALVFIPSANPLRSWDNQHENILPLESPPSRIESPLGISRLKASQLVKWRMIYAAASTLGVAGKWTLIILSLVFVCRASIRSRFIRLWDPVGLWMLLSLFLHLTIYTLLGLTSFPGDAYVVMASPLFICLLARLSSFLMPECHSNNFI
jgi:hypothetical protein